MPPPVSQARKIGVLVLVSLAFAIPGSFAFPSCMAMHRGRALRADAPSFAETTCTPGPVDVEFDPPCAVKLHCYRPVLRCDYVVGGRTYTTDSRYLDLPYTEATRDQAIAAAKRLIASPPPVFYDPDDPSRALLSRDVAFHTTWVGVIIAPLFLVLIALLWVLFAVTEIRKRRS